MNTLLKTVIAGTHPPRRTGLEQNTGTREDSIKPVEPWNYMAFNPPWDDDFDT